MDKDTIIFIGALAVVILAVFGGLFIGVQGVM